MDKFLSWLAASPLASAARAGVAAALGYLLANLDSLNLNPAVAVALAAALPFLSRWANPMDGVFGKNASEIVEE